MPEKKIDANPNEKILLFYGDNGVQDFYESADRKRLILRNKQDKIWTVFKTVEDGVTESKTPLLIPDTHRQAKAKPGEHHYLGAETVAVLLPLVKRETGEVWEVSYDSTWIEQAGRKRMKLVPSARCQ